MAASVRRLALCLLLLLGLAGAAQAQGIPLLRDAEARGATLVASLHAVDLALNEFPRIVGVRDGRIAFDLPSAQVTESLLHELYAAEGAELPTLANEPRFTAHAVDAEAPLPGARCR